ncbi:MAG: type I secretion system permease/ATPase [Sphingomonas sp.]|uniref:type I secretion system permease/ATPase n=1 Tax=Sphingomonas sp. TaxID=28214 RepID=UPI0026202647|nr:type I secretion system permease/ATPase [Sphingomonas sp.]MDK2768034.1 type I secretion system permease/ATPase [Sphingomonas sp.]
MNLRSRLGESELRDALRRVRGGLWGIVALSAMVNILMLTGSIYLMLVYDRVLPGQHQATLISLFLMVIVAFAFYGAFDVMRARMLADVAASLDNSLIGRVQQIEGRVALERPDAKEMVSPTRDLDQLRSFIASAGTPALIDLPWIIFFLLILTMVHYWLGVVTLLGMLVLAGLTAAAERINARHLAAVNEAGARRRSLGDRRWRHAELIASLGMRQRMVTQWQGAHATFLREQAALTDATSTLTGVSKVLRMFLQSAVLTVGAVLVIDGKATAGIIFASSILAGRALAPVDAAIANWRGFVGARQSWSRLSNLLRQLPAPVQARTSLPPPSQTLSVEHLTLTPPAATRTTVSDASFRLQAGQAVGILGPSGSGKSSLVRGVIGAWKPARGHVRLDGATIDQWDPDELGAHIGYLPQSVELFAGTIAQNIARFEPDAPPDLVFAAARAAGVHDLILQLPDGYDLEVGEDGGQLSAGQRQRIALARALYRDPFLVVLDEPNSNLDHEGETALIRAVEQVRARGGIVLMVAHRPAILAAVDLALFIRGGTVQAFGPRDEVLAKVTRPRGAAETANVAVLPQRGGSA